MRVPARFLSALALATAIAPTLSAQTASPSPAPAPAQPASAAPAAGRKPFEFGLSGGVMSMDAAVAAGQQIGARSFGMQFDGGVSFARFLYAGIDFGPQFVSDKASFTQSTTGGDKNSTAMLIYYSAMAGVRTPAARIIPGLAATSLGVYGGASKTTGERGIDNCSNCTTQDITVEGGSFVQPTLVFGDGSTRLRVSDRYYTGGKGIRSVISAGVELGGR